MQRLQFDGKKLEKSEGARLMPQGKAIDLRERQLIVRLKEHFDEERFQGPSVSTKDPSERVAKALGLGERVVKEIVSNYHQTGKLTPPNLALKGKPPNRIQPALETVIRHEIRQRNREGSHVSLRSLSNWLDEHYERIPSATLGRALSRIGFVFGKSRRKSALRERDDVLIARRAYLRTKLANRDAQSGMIRPEVYLDESYVNVNHSSERTWYFAEEGPWVQKPSGKGPRLILVHAIMAEGWVEGAKSEVSLPSKETDRRLPWPDELRKFPQIVCQIFASSDSCVFADHDGQCPLS